MDIGKTIQAARKKAGLTQVELGKKLGVSGSMIGQWENNLRKPKQETIIRLADALGIFVIDLLPNDEWGKISPDRLVSEIILQFNELDGFNDPELNAAFEQFKKEAGLRVDVGFDEATGTREFDVFFLDDDERLMNAYKSLNTEGKREAVKRVEELAQLKQYQKENPPEGQEAASDGQEEGV